MPDLSTDVTPTEDAANLILLWLAIHGGDPQQHDQENPFTVSAEAYSAATRLVATLSAEFGETRLTDRGQIADRMQERFGVQPTPVIPDRPVGDDRRIVVCYDLGHTLVCITEGGPDNP